MRRSLLAAAISLLVAVSATTTAFAANYTGPLYDAGAQLGGDNATVSDLKKDVKANKVKYMVGFFNFDASFLEQPSNLQYINKVVTTIPGRVVPFIRQGEGADETAPGQKIVDDFKTSLTDSKKYFGKKFVKGFGELDIYGWQGGRASALPLINEEGGVSPTDPFFVELVRYATQNKLAVMFHPNAGEIDSVGSLLSQFPSTTFIVHQFPEQFSYDRDGWLNLMGQYNNFYFEVTADHMLYDTESNPTIGLLYKYQDVGDASSAASQMVTHLTQHKTRLLASALGRYQSAIEARPDRFIWGSEAGTQYAFKPAAYSAWTNFTREFIGNLSQPTQQKFAYSTAKKVLGTGYKEQQKKKRKKKRRKGKTSS